MSQIVIASEKLGKKYRIRHEQQGRSYSTLRETVSRRSKEIGRSLVGLGHEKNGFKSSEEFYALRDVSFDVSEGEKIGIIGRNGAGKSTLLKLLGRITEPSEGKVLLRGRVASLLEVGTGFHPELTGRENIFLNGAILGMSKSEITRKFDAIVDFSEVEKFLDTPVKRFSSGMYVRLAFAIAAHLEPEILLIDEVLAVGDVQFQKKCLGKMGEVSKDGRTILFVSHNMVAVSSLCTKGMVLHGGEVVFQLGDIQSAVDSYLNHAAAGENCVKSLRERADRRGVGKIVLTALALHDDAGAEIHSLTLGRPAEIRIHYECVQNIEPKNINLAIAIYSHTGGIVTLLSNQIADDDFSVIPQQGYISCRLPKIQLAPGSYSINVAVQQNNIIQDWIMSAALLNVEPGDYYATGRLPNSQHNGLIYMDQRWSVAEGKT